MSGPHRFRQIPYLVIIVTIFVTIFLTTIAISQQSRQTRSIWDLPAVVRSKPFQRWWWAYKQRVYPGDEIPQMARERAIKQIEEIRVSERTMARTSIVQGDSWISIGPAPILGGQIGNMGNTRAMSGRVADVAVDPGNQNHWLIGGAQGGIWETLDSGLTWRPKTDNQNSMAFGAIAFAPSDPMVIYAGMGEAIFGSDSYGGYGLLKSTNGGQKAGI